MNALTRRGLLWADVAALRVCRRYASLSLAGLHDVDSRKVPQRRVCSTSARAVPAVAF